MELPDNLRYSPDHTWVRVEDGEAAVGISAFAQEQLGEIVFLELPGPGDTVSKGEPFGVIESVKVAQDLLSPVSGEVVARNDALTDAPERINDSPYADGWMVRLRLSDPSELDGLLDAPAYRASLGEQGA